MGEMEMWFVCTAYTWIQFVFVDHTTALTHWPLPQPFVRRKNRACQSH